MNSEEKSAVKSEMVKLFSDKIDQWLSIQENQRDGFEYERSFTHVMQEISLEVFQLSAGKLPKSKNQKKNFRPVMARLRLAKITVCIIQRASA